MASRPSPRALLFGYWVSLFFACAEGQIASNLTLATTPNPSLLGQTVTLTATVTPGASGKVTFYDGVSVLGTRTLTVGQAALTTVLLPAGVRNLRAHYEGNSTYAPSNSTVVSQTVETQPSLAFKPGIGAAVDAASILLNDFNGDGKPDLFVYDYSNTAFVFLGNGDGSFQPAVYQNVGATPASAATADFNGDGNPDVAILTGSGVAILSGNGDGTFGMPATISLPSLPNAFAVADFNGDGSPDFMFSFPFGFPSQMGVMLGNGDGTFQALTMFAAGTEGPFAIGDFNGDSIADVVTGNASTYNIGVFLGNGDGSFQPAINVPYFQLAQLFAIADLNGDGKSDLAIGETNGTNGLYVLLGNGNGTFQAPVFYFANFYDSLSMSSLVVGDTNGDGKLDLISTTGDIPTYNYVSVSLGNGDGTFQNPVVAGAAPGQNIPVAVVGELNGDGKTDLVYTDAGGFRVLLGGAIPDLSVSIANSVGIIKGETGATYTISVANAGQLSTAGVVGMTDTLPSGFTATGISGSGWTCALAALTCTRSDALAAGASYPAITIAVNVSATLSGYATDTATVSNASDLNPANNTASDTVYIRTVAPISLTSSPNPSGLGQPVILTASLNPSATGQVTFYDGVNFLGIATISSGQATLTTDLLASGVRSLIAEYGGDMYYAPSASTGHIQTVTAGSDSGLISKASYAVDTAPAFLAAGDFNLDGIPDLATANTGSLTGTVSVLLGNGDGTFRAAVNYPVSSRATVIAIGDFNGDGKPDLAVGDAGVDVLLGNGDGTFQSSTNLVTNLGGVSVLAVADANRDGIPDLVGAGYVSGSSSVVLIGKGDGTFQPAMFMPIAVETLLAAVADVNGDGIPDLVAADADNYGGPLLTFLGNGDGTFRAPLSSATPSAYFSALAVGDFNGDGKPDAGIVFWGGTAFLAGNGDGTFRAPVVSSMSATSGGPATAGDFNGDGKLDVAVRGYSTNTAIIAFGNGNGTFQSGVTFSTDGYPGNVVVADFNRDGKPDFAVVNQSTNSVNVFLGGLAPGLNITSSHAGSFVVGEVGAAYQLIVSNLEYVGGSGMVTVMDTLPAGLVATAISGTGWTCAIGTLACTRSDALPAGSSFPPIELTVNVASSLIPSTINNRATVVSSAGTGASIDPTVLLAQSVTSLGIAPASSIFGQAVTLTATVTAGASGTVEFLDGANVLGVASLISSQAPITTSLLPAGLRQLRALYGGDSTHVSSISTAAAFNVTAVAGGGFTAGANNPAGNTLAAIASGDFNHDGKTDLVTANTGGSSVSILLGNGDGTFGPRKDSSVASAPVAVAVGDLNGDGKPDLAVLSQGAGSLTILLGNGDGTFQTAESYAAGSGVSVVVVADFNGDGKPDVAVCECNQYAFAALEVFFGNGDGTLEQPHLTPGFNPSSVLVAADLNGDGKADLILGGYILLGNGDGTFTMATEVPVSTSLAVGDMNGDGKADLVLFGGSGVEIELGNGEGGFTAGGSVSSSYNGTVVAAGDVNGDGKLDVIVAGSTSTMVTVFLGNGDGTLQSGVSFTAASSVGMAVGEFNGDGRTDLALADTLSNNVGVLLGIVAPVLTITSVHGGDFYSGETGATYTITVSNPSSIITGGTVTVTDTLPYQLAATAIGGSGWTCVLSTRTCTRSDALAAGASYPVITVTVTASAIGSVTNQVEVSGGGSGSVTALDPTNIAPFPPPVLLSPANGATGVSLTAALSWSAVAGVTSYSVFFGTSSTPSLLASTTATSYSLSALSPSTTYYWQVAAINTTGSAGSTIWSFTTPVGLPAPVSVSPAAGSGGSQTFTFSLTDPAGYADLSVVDILINNYLDGIGACYVALAPASASSGYLYLVDNAGDGGYVNGTPMLLPSSLSFANSQCTINGTGSSVSATGNTLTLTLNITFASAFAGNKIFYMAARSATQNSGWQALGTWRVPGPAVVGPGVGSVTPGRSVSTGQTYTFTFTDSNGYADLAVLDILTNSFLDGTSACYVAYVPTSASNGYLYLVDDAGDGGYASGSPILLSSGGTLTNSQCTISTAGSSATASGTTLNLNLAVTFSSSFAGNQVFYLASRNSTTGNSGWQAAGSVTVP